MTGYVRPCKGQMKCKDWDSFQGVYCGVCRALGKRYGQIYRNLLSYDFVLYAFLLLEETPACPPRRCLAHPVTRRPCAKPEAALDTAADATVLFARHKLEDTVLEIGRAHV